MDAFLLHGGRSYPIPDGDLIRVGSLPACNIQLLNDTSVSRRHCSVSFLGGHLTLVDLGSTHGTFLNGKEISRKPVAVQDGDEIRVGQTMLKVALGDPEAVGGGAERNSLNR